MIKRIMTDLLPVLCEGTFTVILGLMLVTAWIRPTAALAQTGAPPPVHSFGLEQGSNAAESDSDELILIDLFDLSDEASPSGSPPMPSLPPNVAPVVSEPTAASPPPVASPPSTDSGPPAGPPLVNLPSIPVPTETASPVSPPVPAETPPPVQAQTPPISVPPAPVQTPPESVLPVQVPAGYTPLPTVPLQTAPESIPDPFALPPVSEPESTPAGLAAPADSSVPLGQTQRVPAPQWENADPNTTPSQSQIISGSPLPQFDASQSNWIQLEIGQGDGSGQASSAVGRPTSVYSLPDPAVRPLDPAPVPVEKAVDAATDQALDQAISQPPAAAGRNITSPDGREQLRHLFSDMLPPDNAGARAPTINPPTSSGQASPGTAPKVGTLPKAEPAAAGAAQPTSPKNDEEVGSSAILQAGGLLTVDEHFGAAEILPPLSGRPRWPAPETSPPAKPASAPQAAATKPELPAISPNIKSGPAKPASQPAAKPAPAKSSGSGSAKKGGSKKPAGGAPAAPAGVGLIIINETGRDRVGQQYRSVLAQMGYKVVSASDGRPGRGTAGQTVINYRPGLKAQAQAVARHLPGKKVLAEAKKGQVLASEIMIYIR